MAAVMMSYSVRDSFQGYPQQYAMYQTRAHQPQVDVASSLTVNPYANFQSAPEAQQYIQPQAKSHPPATSIITEDGFRPSLPSISNLLGIADGERGSQDAGTSSKCFLSSHDAHVLIRYSIATGPGPLASSDASPAPAIRVPAICAASAD
jgi:hypothetical protein